MLWTEDLPHPSTTAGRQEVSSTCTKVAVREGFRAPCRHRVPAGSVGHSWLACVREKGLLKQQAAEHAGH